MVELLGDFSGTLVVDMAITHFAGARDGPGDIVLAACWAHAFRKFRVSTPLLREDGA